MIYFFSLRSRINLLDRMNVLILVQRMRTATKVGEIKRAVDIPVHNSKREEKVFSDLLVQLGKLNPQPVSFESLKGIWLEIIKVSKRLEGNNILSFLGPYGSHSDSPELYYSSVYMKGMPFRTLSEVFYQFRRSDMAFLPLENNYSGTLINTIKLMSEADVGVSKIVSSPIHQALVVQCHPERLGSNLLVQSHALTQCRVWINGTHCLKKNMSSTAKATIMTRYCNVASLASLKTKQLFDSRDLDQTKSSTNNKTKFIQISKRCKNIKSINYCTIIIPEGVGVEVVMMLIMVFKTKVKVLDLVTACSELIIILFCSNRGLLYSLIQLFFFKRVAFCRSAVNLPSHRKPKDENIKN